LLPASDALAEDENEENALTISVKNGDVNALKVLLPVSGQAGAQQALMRAAMLDCTMALAEILGHADAHKLDVDGVPVLMWAASRASLAAEQLLPVSDAIVGTNMGTPL